MLENYTKDHNGIIKQINYKQFVYDVDYSSRYDKYTTNNDISHLRLGYLIGSIGKIPNSILDVGYGNGAFLNTAKKITKCYGHDISNYPIPENVEFVRDIFNSHYEVICFFDVLEHYPDIYFLDKLNCDYLIISLPECHYFSDEWFKNWKHRRPDEHLWHFNKISLENFIKEQGYDLINFSNVEDIIRPGIRHSNILSGVFKKRRF